MRLSSPPFWYQRFNPAGLLLSPLSLLYWIAQRFHRYLIPAYRTGIPVICLGNLVAGGSGKTPAALAVMAAVKNEMLAEKPCFMSRGYTGREKGPLLVDPGRHTAVDVGDEPLLLAKYAPVIIGGDREKSARLAEDKGFDAIVMDDGLQNPGLHKTVRLVVVDGKRAFGNGFLLPAGPLREPVRSGLERADAVILVGEDRRNVARRIPKGTALFRADLKIPESWIADGKTRYVAFSGLAHPDKFYETLKCANVNLVRWRPFPDHHAFTDEELGELAAIAQQEDARLLTTAKDAARLPHEFIRGHVVDILPIELVWTEPEKFKSFLKKRLELFKKNEKYTLQN